MPVARSARRLLSLIFLVGIGIFCCLILFQENRYKKKSETELRRIVAYSLLKQIEIESEEVNCEKFEEAAKKENSEGVWTKIHGANIWVYGVYQDSRLYPYGYIRIVAMVKGTWNTTFCQIESSDHQVYITRAKATKIWSKNWNQNDTHEYFEPYLISCHVPLHKTPIQVSLNTKPCLKGPQNFKIPLNSSIKTAFTVCVKPLNFSQDISKKLLQWLVLNKILGAGKIEIYVETVPPITLKVLRVFGSVVSHQHQHIVKKKLDKATELWQKRRYEIITYNDCLYRNIHTSQFIVPVDIDEVIVPRHVVTWAELLHDFLDEDKYASYTVRNAYYLRQFNTKTHKGEVFFFKNIVRSEFSELKESMKSFISTKNALTVFNHYALRALRPGVRRMKFLEKDEVQMNHYKDGCDTVVLPECAKYLSSRVRVADDVVGKYKRVFYEEYKKLKKVLNL